MLPPIIVVGVAAFIVIAIVAMFLVIIRLIRIHRHDRTRRLGIDNSRPVDFERDPFRPPLIYFAAQSPILTRRRRLVNLDGLSMQELNDAAPVRPFAKPSDSFSGSEENICAVCLEDMAMDTKTRKMPCGHEFDAKCIEEWVTKANRCPVCNVSIVEEEALRKRRLAIIEGRDPSPPSTRERRRRIRGDNGMFHIQDARAFREQVQNGSELRSNDSVMASLASTSNGATDSEVTSEARVAPIPPGSDPNADTENAVTLLDTAALTQIEIR